MIRILHTSDLQLDASLGFLGEKAVEHRRRLLSTFCRILDLASDDGYDLAVIAGDLFDTSRPTEQTLTAVQRACAGCKVPVAILPGNHDHYGRDSIYRDGRWPGNVHIMDGQPWKPDHLDLLVHGHPLSSTQDNDPLQGVMRQGGHQYEIALAHGNVERADLSKVSRPIPFASLQATEMNYVAMGDWHSPGDYSQGKVTAWYSGAPEPTSFSQSGAGYVLDVRLDCGAIRVERVRVAQGRADSQELDITGCTVNQVSDRILEWADPDLMLDIHLFGTASSDELLDVEAMAESMASHFFHIRISDESHLLEASLDAIEQEGSPLRSNYVRLMHERIDKARDDAERQKLQKALLLGLALLDGKRVLQ